MATAELSVPAMAGRNGESDHVGRVASGSPLGTLYYNAGGDWGIFDAAAPWGPWTTVFHNDASTSGASDNPWGIPGTHSYRLPAKWISPDGLTMTLIFSG